jgi:hypothetical protein
MPVEPTEPWERRDGETAKAFAAFAVYRDLGPGRSVAKAYQRQTGRRPASNRAAGHWVTWATRNDWQGRARAWDDRKDREARQAELDQIKQMKERHALFLRGGFSKAFQRLAGMRPEELSPRDAYTLGIQTMNQEWLLHGQPTQITRELPPGHDDPNKPDPALPTYKPTPEFLAEVMQILDDHGALDPRHEPVPDDDGGEGAVNDSVLDPSTENGGDHAAQIP